MKNHFILCILTLCMGIAACDDGGSGNSLWPGGNEEESQSEDNGADGLKGYWIRDEWTDWGNYEQGETTFLFYFDGQGAGKFWDTATDYENALLTWDEEGQFFKVGTFIDHSDKVTYYAGWESPLTYVLAGQNLMVMADGDDFHSLSYNGNSISGYHRIKVYDPGDADDPVVQEENRAEEIAKACDVDIRLDGQVWNVTIRTTLDSKYPGKDLRFGMSVDIETSYRESYYKEVKVKRTAFGDDKEYAQKEGDVYVASMGNPFYFGMYGITFGGEEDMVDDVNRDKLADIQTYILEMLNVKKYIDKGEATETEIEFYESLPGKIRGLIDNIYYVGYGYYCQSVVRTWVELDGKRYELKEQSGPVRIICYDDEPFGIKSQVETILYQ